MFNLKQLILLILLCASISCTAQFFQCQQVTHSTFFGCNLQGLNSAQEIVAVRDSLKQKYIRHSVTLQSYNPGTIDAGLQSRYNGGLKVICNLNWSSLTPPSKVFATNLTLYKAQIDSFLNSNAQFLNGGCLVIENEPLNTHFYDYAGSVTAAQYIAEIGVAVAECRRYNVQVMDGCTHLAYYPDLCAGPPFSAILTRRADSCWKAFQSMNLNYVNYHFEASSIAGGNPSALITGILTTDANCAYNNAGNHPISSNEWHQEDVGTQTNWLSMMSNIVLQTRQAHVRYAINFGGGTTTSGQALELYDPNTLTLTALGRRYRDEVLRVEPASTSWQNLPMGGGGYVTGIVIHPLDSSVQYIRTDLGGAYRWQTSTQTWIPITDMFDINSNNLYFIDGIAVDPTNTSNVWMYAGMNGSPQGIYKSVNQGASWTQMKSVPAFGDGSKRIYGEALQIDAKNSSVIYCGTRNAGLIRSLDGGTTWTTITSVPKGDTTTPVGIRNVTIDTSSTISGRSANIYAAIYGTGVYKSTDGGTTFSIIASCPTTPHRMAVGSNGVLYVTTDVGVSKYNGTSWTNISPTAQAYTAIAVAPDNANKLVVSTDIGGVKQPIFLSTDGGTTWSANKVTLATFNYAASWYTGTDRFSAATSSIIFNTQNTNIVTITDAYSVWRTNDITLTNTVWNQLLRGHEEMVVLGMASPPHPSAGQSILYSGVADDGLFRSVDTTSYPTHFGSGATEGTDIDYCESFPQYVMSLGASDVSTGSTGKIFFSRDRGVTFSSSGLAVPGVGGNVAYSSTDSTKIVVSPVVGVPVFSTNKGVSWTASTGATSRSESNTLINKKVLIADKVNGNTFYYMNSGTMYKSTDGGATYTATGYVLSGATSIRLKSVVGHTGDLWLAVRSTGAGLYHSTNGGTSFTKLSNITDAESVAIGKDSSGASYPTVYFYGILNSVVGIFRSTDQGSTWVQVNDPSIMMGQEPRVMEADREKFGKIYIGTGGRGIFYSFTTP